MTGPTNPPTQGIVPFSIPISGTIDSNGMCTLDQVVSQAMYSACFVAIQAPGNTPLWTMNIGGQPFDFAQGGRVTLGPAPCGPAEHLSVALSGGQIGKFVTGNIWGNQSFNVSDIVGQLPIKSSSAFQTTPTPGSSGMQLITRILSYTNGLNIPIPQTFDHLEIWANRLTTAPVNSQVVAVFNGDVTAAHYPYNYLQNGVYVSGTAAGFFGGFAASAGDPTAGFRMSVFDYTSGNVKTVLSSASRGATLFAQIGGYFENLASPIISLRLQSVGAATLTAADVWVYGI